jgi:F-type H+-transporting ATPase subunit a
VLALEFPPISHLVEWPDIVFNDTAYAVNKVTLLFVIGLFIVVGFFLYAGAKRQMLPRGVQNIAESGIDFVRSGIIDQTIGHGGEKFLPLLMTMFTFILCLNVIGLLPLIQMPANARMALPVFMAIVVWLVYMGVGIVKQGPIGYFKGIAFPPGVPAFLYILVTPIELVSTIIVRPLSLSVRLFANLLAGHLILVTFAVMTDSLFSSGLPAAVLFPLTFALLVALTGFELLVAFLQAYIFTILAAVYIGGSLHPEH